MADLDPSAPAPGATARTVSARTLVAVLGALILIAAVVVAVMQTGRVRDLESDLDAPTDVAAAAATFGEVYLSYDFDDPERSCDRVLELVSPDFAEDFETTRAPGIEELFANLGTTTDATTTEVFVGDLSEDTARALVVVDVVATSAASGTQQLTDLTFVLELVLVDGRWLVDNVVPAPQPDLTGDGIEPPEPPATTTTTAAP